MTITRIIVKFEGFAGKYVWPCHLLEHEDNEMMRPYIITAT
jgi:spore coat protein A